MSHTKTLTSILLAVFNGLLRRTDARMVVNGLCHGLTDGNGFVYQFTCFLVYISHIPKL